MTQGELRGAVVDWLRVVDGMLIEGEDFDEVCSSARIEFAADTATFVSDAAFIRVLRDLHQLPRQDKSTLVWRWHPRIPLMEHYLSSMHAADFDPVEVPP